MPKKTITIPLSRFYKDEALALDFPFVEKGAEVIINVADIIEDPVNATFVISSYYVGEDIVHDQMLRHFSEYNCCHERALFFQRKVLCLYEGIGTWHLPGNCKINKDSMYKAIKDQVRG